MTGPHKISRLEVHNIRKAFKNAEAVNDISFTVNEGDIFAFLGPNGAGKTTTLRMILDIIRPDSGSVRWRMNDADHGLPPPSLIGYLPEERGLYPDIPVIRSLVYLGCIRGMEAGNARRSAMEWLERLELSERAGEKLQTLSKGNQQKIQFVAAILHKPSFAILDEPFSGLDPLNQEKFLEYIRELNNAGTTILLSAHQMPLVEKIARTVFLIHKGEEIYHGPLPGIYKTDENIQPITITFANEVPVGKLNQADGILGFKTNGTRQAVIELKKGTSLDRFLGTLSGIGGVSQIECRNPDLHDIFLNLVKNHQA